MDTFVTSSVPGRPKMTEVISQPKLVNKWQFQSLRSDPEQPIRRKSAMPNGGDATPLLYQRMQALVQQMLHSDTGVPIRSHRNKLFSAIPSVFTGSDLIAWLIKKLPCNRAEATHLANMLYRHGYFFCIDKDEPVVKDDSTLFRFQTPNFWPSQKYDDSDFEYAVYLVKLVKRSKQRIKLADYELVNLQELQKKLILQWDYVNDRADEELRGMKDQKKIARALIESQEKAFWRLRKPPPTDRPVTDCLLAKCGTSYVNRNIPVKPETEESLRNEIKLLKKILALKRNKLSTTLEGLTNHCAKYDEFDPFLHVTYPSNPWITNEDTYWTLERSLISSFSLENPFEVDLKKWACSINDVLSDVTGRFKFEKFCKKQFCLENVRFWQACRDLQLLPLVSVPGSVQLIYDEFIDPNAPSMVNLNYQALEQAQKDVKNPTRFAFCLAQEQIYTLMKNDIYPRFLKTDYEVLKKNCTPTSSIGKSFLKKFISRSHSQRSMPDKSIPVEIVSPNHPERYTKRQLSISRASSDSNFSSLNDIFLSVTSLDSASNYRDQSNSNLILALTSPTTETNPMLLTTNEKVRRISAPIGPRREDLESTQVMHKTSLPDNAGFTPASNGLGPTLYEEEEEDEEEAPKVVPRPPPLNRGDTRRIMTEVAIRNSLVYSHSMEELSQAKNDDENEMLSAKNFETTLMSLRNPPDMFDVHLDRKKSLCMEDLKSGPTSPVFVISDSEDSRRPSKASVAAQTFVSIQVPSPDNQLLYSSNESVHSTISN